MDYKDNMKRMGIECPGPEPEGETPAPENQAFVSACMSAASARAASVGWRLGKSILTHSDAWGFLFRIDLQSPDESQNLYVSHRLVFWSAGKAPTIAGTALFPDFDLKPL